MAFFKSRKGGDEPTAASNGPGPRQPESIEAMRRRAKHRLIGASVLVLIGVVGFPLLFDTQPRPISVDIPIEIPDRNKARPLPAPAPARATTQAPAPAPASTPSVSAPVTAAPAPAPVPAAAPAPVASVAKTEPRSAEPLKPAKTEAKAPAVDEGTKAQALLDAKPLASTPVIAEGRFVVQVGAFADVAKAREARARLERAGMKTYTQVVETKDGKRVRVRVGPFESKADADKAAVRIKGLDLRAAVLTLS
jgi:DedD protein